MASPAVALAFAEALERVLGEEEMLTVGISRASITGVVGEEPVRVPSISFTVDDGADGFVALVALASFADALENCAADELLMTSCAPALAATVKAIGRTTGSEIELARPFEIDLESIVDAQDDSDMAVFVLLDGTKPVGCLVIGIGVAEPSPMDSTRRSAPTGTSPRNEISLNPLVALADVQMAVTAELGRFRMTARELLSLRSGAVIDLDRTVGEPVDVLVNGTPIARGEVVVIDDEFGVRISEILGQETRSR
jgi:flagellar motor switch protein FliN/FliY